MVERVLFYLLVHSSQKIQIMVESTIVADLAQHAVNPQSQTWQEWENSPECGFSFFRNLLVTPSSNVLSFHPKNSPKQIPFDHLLPLGILCSSFSWFSACLLSLSSFLERTSSQQIALQHFSKRDLHFSNVAVDSIPESLNDSSPLNNPTLKQNHSSATARDQNIPPTTPTNSNSIPFHSMGQSLTIIARHFSIIRAQTALYLKLYLETQTVLLFTNAVEGQNLASTLVSPHFTSEHSILTPRTSKHRVSSGNTPSLATSSFIPDLCRIYTSFDEHLSNTLPHFILSYIFQDLPDLVGRLFIENPQIYDSSDSTLEMDILAIQQTFLALGIPWQESVLSKVISPTTNSPSSDSSSPLKSLSKPQNSSLSQES